MLLEENCKLVMIGDSVTDCDRARPLGEGLFGGIGKSYAGLVDALLNTVYPERHIRVINMGVSGNTIRDLAARWETDVFDLKPDWLTIMIGINDVWRQFDTPMITEGQVPLEEYEKTLDHLVAITKDRVKGLLLFTPYYIEENPSDRMRARMDEYGAVVKKIAAKYGTMLIDTQEVFTRGLKYFHSAYYTWDRIHPNITGHMMIARAFLNKVGFDWNKED